MPDWTSLAVNSFQGFFLIVVRIMAILAFVPFFGFKQIPNTAKLGFTYFLALLLMPLINIPKLPIDIYQYAFLVAQQIFIGVLFGFVSFIFFTAIQTAGQIMDIQMGFGMANILDPITGLQQTIIGQVQFLIAILFFLAINGHHLLLIALQKSFQIIPLDGMSFGSNVMPFIIKLFSEMFEVALKLALPVMAAIFLADVSMGFMARLMPQMNILVMGFPIKIFIGLAGIVISLNFYFYIYPELFKRTYVNIVNLLNLLKPVP